MQSYQDLEVWELTMELIDGLEREQGLDGGRNGLGSQIRHAALSITSNIAEGFGRGNRGDYHRFLTIARGSCTEVQAQLRVAYRGGHIKKQRFEHLLDLALRIGWMIGSLMRRLK